MEFFKKISNAHGEVSTCLLIRMSRVSEIFQIFTWLVYWNFLNCFWMNKFFDWHKNHFISHLNIFKIMSKQKWKICTWIMNIYHEIDFKRKVTNNRFKSRKSSFFPSHRRTIIKLSNRNSDLLLINQSCARLLVECQSFRLTVVRSS